MLRRERWVFCLLVGAALAIVFTARVTVPSVARVLRTVAPHWGWPRAATAGLAAIPQQSLNPTLAGLPARAHPTVTPHRPESPVCASYFQRSPSPDFVQGTWTDDPEATKSLESCYEWMDHAILRKRQCAQPGATAIMVVLVDKSRHTYNLPVDLNMETEFVVQQECLR